MESYAAPCVYVTDSGGAINMDEQAARVQAYDRVLKPETQPPTATSVSGSPTRSWRCRMARCG